MIRWKWDQISQERLRRNAASVRFDARFILERSTTDAMNSSRYHHTASLLGNGTVLVTGEEDNSGRLNIAELCNPWTGVWRVTGTMNNSRYGHTAWLLGNGTVLVNGGYGSSGNPVNSAELYDLWKRSWCINVTHIYDFLLLWCLRSVCSMSEGLSIKIEVEGLWYSAICVDSFLIGWKVNRGK